MMEWISTTPFRADMILLSAILIYAVMIALTRLCGLRSFSKVSSFDFVMTIAVGSVLAGVTLSESPALFKGAAALSILFGMQVGIAYLRGNSSVFAGFVDNRLRLLIRDGSMIPSAMKMRK